MRLGPLPESSRGNLCGLQRVHRWRNRGTEMSYPCESTASATPPHSLPRDFLMGGNSGGRFHRWLEAGFDLQMAHQITLPGAAGGGWLCHHVLEETEHQAMAQGQGMDRARGTWDLRCSAGVPAHCCLLSPRLFWNPLCSPSWT